MVHCILRSFLVSVLWCSGFATLVALGTAESAAETAIHVVLNPSPDTPRRAHRETKIDNCAGLASPQHLQVSCSSVSSASTGAETEFTLRGTVRYGVAEAELKARVRNELQRQLGGTIEETNRMTLQTPRGQSLLHSYDLVTQYQSGYIEISRRLLGIEYQAERVGFSYCISARYEVTGAQQLRCPQVFLDIANVALKASHQFGAGCRDGWKHFDISATVTNFGDLLAQGYDIFADVRPVQGGQSYRVSMVHGIYIAIGATRPYSGLLSMQCASHPPGTRFTINVVAAKAGSPPNFNESIYAHLQY